MNLVRVSGKYDSLCRDALSIDRVEGASSDEFGGRWRVGVGKGGIWGLKEEGWDRAKLDGAGKGNEGCAARLEVLLELVNVVRGVTGLRVEWIDEESAGTGGEDELLLGFEGCIKLAVGGEGVVNDRKLVLVAEERVNGERLGRVVVGDDAAWGVAEEDLDAGSGWDTTDQGFTEDLVLGTLVIFYPE